MPLALLGICHDNHGLRCTSPVGKTKFVQDTFLYRSRRVHIVFSFLSNAKGDDQGTISWQDKFIASPILAIRYGFGRVEHGALSDALFKRKSTLRCGIKKMYRIFC